jgi:hypothetical protein
MGRLRIEKFRNQYIRTSLCSAIVVPRDRVARAMAVFAILLVTAVSRMPLTENLGLGQAACSVFMNIDR